MLVTSLNYGLSLGFAATFLLGGTGRRDAAAHVPQPGGTRSSARWRRAKPSPARRCRSRSPSPAGTRARRVTSSRRRRTDVTARRAARCRAAGDAGGAGAAAARRRRAGPGHAVDRMAAGTLAGVGLRSLSACGRRLPGAGAAAPPLPSRARRPRPRRRVRGDDATSPGCAATSPAIRCSASRGRRSPAAPAGTPSSSRGSSGGGPRPSTGARCRRSLDAEAAAVPPGRLGARRRARGAAVLAGAARRRAARRPGARPPAHALTALALHVEGAAMRAPRRTLAAGRPCCRRRRSAGWACCCSPSQLPQLPFLPVWVAGFGVLLVAAAPRRCSRATGPPPGRVAGRASPRWRWRCSRWSPAAAIRVSFGYFVGRDPCVAFLFVLVGIKFLEARNARDATLLVCLASFLVVTPFFYSQSPLVGAGRHCRRCSCWAAALQALRAAARARRSPPWRRRAQALRRADAAGRSARGAAVPAVPAAGGSAVGAAHAIRWRRRGCPTGWRPG